MLSEFKKFALRGNVVDLAVGVIIGGAFGKIVTSLVGDVVMPLIGILVGKVSFASLAFTIGEGPDAPAVKYGLFIQSAFDFLIVAFVIFLAVRGINKATTLGKKTDAVEEVAVPTTKDCPHCLSTIPIKATRCGHCTSQL